MSVLRRPAFQPARLRSVGQPTRDYSYLVRETRPGNLIGYWPLDETVGSTAYDWSGRGHNGAYTGVDLGRPGMGDGRPAPYFDGTNDYGIVNSSSALAAFSGAEGTLLALARVASSAVWSDGVGRRIMRINVTANTNEVVLRRVGATIEGAYYAGGVAKQVVSGTLSSTGWLPLAFTWSATADQVRMYLAGRQISSTLTGLGVWAGVPSEIMIGAQGVVTLAWHGWLAHCALWTAALSPSEVWALTPLWMRGA